MQSRPAAPYFLGPKSENAAWTAEAFAGVLQDWFEERQAQFADDGPAVGPKSQADPACAAERRRLEAALADLSAQLRGELPAYTPRYLGHMTSELSLPGLLGHFAALLHNPNNTSREASRVGTALESQAIDSLAEMVGFDPTVARGHFTSGGTLANLEAVWRARFRLDTRLALGLAVAERTNTPLSAFHAAHLPARSAARLLGRHGLSESELRAASGVLGNALEAAERISSRTARPYRGPVILAPAHRHYSWLKAANLFGLGEEAFWSAPLDGDGRLCLAGLAARIEEARQADRPILMVVTVAGTTEMGLIDPVDGVAEQLRRLRERDIDIWHHVDAAYGGFFCAMDADKAPLERARRNALRAVQSAETVTIDPHKLGYSPYACGALLARDADCDAVSPFAAPYIERGELGDAPWMRTIEGSRPATGAAATWLTAATLGFHPEGIGAVLSGTVESCRLLRAALTEAVPEVRPLDPMDTNIFCFSVARPGEPLSVANLRTTALHARLMASPAFSMSRTVLSTATHAKLIARHAASHGGTVDTDRLVLVRCVVMNPFWAEPAVRSELLPQLTRHVEELIQEGPAPGAAPLRDAVHPAQARCGAAEVPARKHQPSA